jgi:hypothetical protein
MRAWRFCPWKSVVFVDGVVAVGDVLDGLGEGGVGCVEWGVHGEFVFVFLVHVAVFAHVVIEDELALAPGRLGAGCQGLGEGGCQAREGGEAECVLHDRFCLILGMRIVQIVVLSSQSMLEEF